MDRFITKGEIRECESVVLRGELRRLLEGHRTEVLHFIGTIERACVWATEVRGWREDEVALLLAYATSLMGWKGIAFGEGSPMEGRPLDRKDLGLGWDLFEHPDDPDVPGPSIG